MRRAQARTVLERTEEGRQMYYQANPECPIFEELKGVAAKTFGVAGVLKKRLARKISFIAYSADEFAVLVAKENHFLTTALKDPIIWLIGNRQALDEFILAKARKPRARKAAQR